MKYFLSAISWLLLIGVATFAYLGLTEDEREANEETSYEYLRKKALLERLQSLPTKAQEIRARIADLGGRNVDAYLYEGGDADFRAYVQRDLGEIARAHSVSLRSVRPSDVKQYDEQLDGASVQLSFSSNYNNFLAFLGALEQHQPILKPVRVNVSVSRASTQYSAAVLDISMEVKGYRKSPKVGSGS